jgi:hypothetical protein
MWPDGPEEVEMRRILLFTMAGLGVAFLLVPARAGDYSGNAAPSIEVKLSPKDAACGSYGTAVQFVSNPSEAAQLAKKEEKLVFVLHVSGLFEDPKLT